MQRMPLGYELVQLRRFLDESAAALRTAEPKTLLDLTGPTMKPTPDQRRYMERHPLFHPIDAPVVHAAPFASHEVLGPDVHERIAQIHAWLPQLPAAKWMLRQAAIQGAMQSFRRVQVRRRDDPYFSDVLADLRFWVCTVQALNWLYEHHMPEMDRAKRQSAAHAARRLRTLLNSTPLEVESGLAAQERAALRGAIEKIECIGARRRRARFDAHSGDRTFICRLTELFWDYMGGATPPSVIAQLASLKVQNPDLTMITKQVTKHRAELQRGKRLRQTLAGCVAHQAAQSSG